MFLYPGIFLFCLFNSKKIWSDHFFERIKEKVRVITFVHIKKFRWTLKDRTKNCFGAITHFLISQCTFDIIYLSSDSYGYYILFSDNIFSRCMPLYQIDSIYNTHSFTSAVFLDTMVYNIVWRYCYGHPFRI